LGGGVPKRNEVTREWKKLHNEELNDLYSSPEQYWNGKNEMDEACSTYGAEERLCRVLMGKPEGKRPLWRTRSRWEDNIKMDL
jgi:hypothetical protein